ncbi:MAG TPA: glycosyl hydrolase family 28-related protein [Kiritimatiellia bacterium]|nr:glycosyl hydrolase family 28-related protein [Kiritimatiellia bacterium]
MKKVLISLFSVTALSFAACLDVRADEKDRRPVIFWASEPVRPGETAMVIGENLGDHPAIEIVRLPDGRAKEPLQENVVWPRGGTPVDVLQAAEQSAKFIVPADFKPGLLRLRLAAGGAAVEHIMNRPQIWWVQGECGPAVTPGGWIRFFGKNLGWGIKDGIRKPVIRIEGPCVVSLAFETDGHAARAVLPKDMPSGSYRLFAHNGAGGRAGWSAPVELTVTNKEVWPQNVFNVTNFGALADGVKDDTVAIQNALSAAESQGGGIVYLPLGRYAVSDTLNIPRRTVLRGERSDWVALAWSDMRNPPWALVQGTNSFGLEDLTIYAHHHHHVIAADLGDKPDAGNVFLRRVRVRASSYRGHLTPDEVDARFRETMKWSTGGGDTVRMGGSSIEITECDFYGSGRTLFLSRVRGGLVADNRFFNGRWGWYCISGSDGLIFENNEITGADLMSTGGGLNCLDGSRFSQNVYYADNRLQRMHGWDREAMTSDAGGEAYSGKAVTAHGTTLVLDGKPNWRGQDWRGAGVFVLAGKGAGQYRRVAGQGEQSVIVDRPWDVVPGTNSDICVTMFQGHYILSGNEFSDCGAVQFYGTAVENIVVRNTGTRMSGFRGIGLWYHGYQPNWFCEFRDNAIKEGNYYHWNRASDALLEITGYRRAPYTGPLNVGSVVRHNRLDSQAHIRVGAATRDAIVEGNHVANSAQGIFVSVHATNIWLHANTFEKVREEIMDDLKQRRIAQERLSRHPFFNRPEPVAVWDFEKTERMNVADVSGNGFRARLNGGATTVSNGVGGRAGRFDGTGWLCVNEVIVFNAPDMTVSLWIKPETLRGRRGLVGKRFSGCEAPFILSQNGARLSFEATDTEHQWSFNFVSEPVLKEGQWTHVAAVVRRGKGVALFANGKKVAEKQNASDRIVNHEPLILGREAWGGEPASTSTPGYFIGLMDEVRIWTRALSPDEIEKEASRRPAGNGFPRSSGSQPITKR